LILLNGRWLFFSLTDEHRGRRAGPGDSPSPKAWASRITSSGLAPVRDSSVPRAQLLWVAAFLLLEVIAADAPAALPAAMGVGKVQ